VVVQAAPGVSSHDGSNIRADAVIWNPREGSQDRRNSDTRQSAQVRPRLPGLLSYRRPATGIEIKTKSVDSLFPYQRLWFLVSSPAQWEKVGKDWNKFALDPSGTGPFQARRFVPRERAQAHQERGLWNPKRIPKVDRIVLICAPEDRAAVPRLISGADRHDRRTGARRAGPAEAGRRPDLDNITRTCSNIIPRWSRDRRGRT